MHRLVLASVVLFAATSAQSQSAGRPTPPAPRSSPSATLPVQRAPQAAPRARNLRAPQIQTAPSAPASLTPAARAQAVQQLMNTPTPPAPGATIHLAVSAPIGTDGASLAYQAPRQIWTAANIAFFDIGVPDSYLWIMPPTWPAGLKLFDCAVTSAGGDTFDWSAGSGAVWVGGQAPVVDGHVTFVAATTPAQSVMLSATGAAGLWTVRWCDITRLGA